MRGDGPAVGQLADWRGYWRDPYTLWVYDTSPEVGLNSFYARGTSMDNIRAAGMRLMRHEIHWNEFAANKVCGSGAGGVQENLDGVVSAAQQKGVEILLLVTNGEGTCPYAPADRPTQVTGVQGDTAWANRYASFVASLATRYPSVHFFQIWNEPDAMGFGVPYFASTTEICPSGDRTLQGKRYAALLRAVSQRVKAVRSDAYVVTAGLTGGDGQYPDPTLTQHGLCADPQNMSNTWSFLRGMYANGAKSYFDFLAIHAYGITPTSDYALSPKLSQVTSIINESGIGDGGRPVWVTEFGAASYSTSNYGALLDPAQRSHWPFQFDSAQTAWYQGALSIQSSGRQATKMFGFSMEAADSGVNNPDPNRSFADPNHDYGLALFRGSSDFTVPRPAFRWLRDNPQDYKNTVAIDAAGGRNGEYSLPVYANVPADRLFGYDGSSVVIGSLNVKTLTPTAISFITPVAYNVYQNGAWQAQVYNNWVAGTPGAGALQAITLQKWTDHGLPSDYGICYSAYVAGQGWQSQVCNGTQAGVVGQQMQGLKIQLTSTVLRADTWHVCYQAYVSGAWQSEVCDGYQSGTIGSSMQAVRVRFRHEFASPTF